MRYQFIITTLFVVFCAFTPVKAQDTIIESLLESRPYEGEVSISASPGVNQLIGRKSSSDSAVEYQKSSGYRIQAYSSNAPKTSRAEAFRRQELVKEAFPDISTYVTYVAPYWRLRVGDFRSQEEATLFMKQFEQELPSLKKESYVVKDEIRISF